MPKETRITTGRSIEDDEPDEDPIDSEDPADPVDPDPEPLWGDIEKGYYLWPTVIRILLVIDGRIILNRNRNDFGLGYVLSTMLTPSAWWVSFEIDIARRVDELTDEALLDGHQIKYQKFKFTDPGFDINSYDQVWLFGDLPNNDDGADDAMTDADILTDGLDDAELKVIADWMDHGGGVFATGDHSILGASLSSRIPRVRTMRKWTLANGVPGRDGVSRNETLQPNSATRSWEQDQLMQPIELIYQPVSGSLPFPNNKMPHPLLCSNLGPIKFFPDHMHEGELISDEDVKLDRHLDIPGYDRPEYPIQVGTGGESIQPRPHVIAFGRTTHDPIIADTGSSFVGGSTAHTGPKRFGLVGVYDGDPVNIGRVVVDSTWHHWLSYNLAPHDFRVPVSSYQKMQAYYRNVGLWLARPAQRQAMAVAGAWGILTGSPLVKFNFSDNVWDIGERVLEVFENTASPCIRKELADTVLGESLRLGPSVQVHTSEPVWSKLPVELTNRAVFGGIGSALIDLALAHRDARAAGQRPPLDAEAIRERAVTGISLARELVLKAVEDAAAAFSSMSSDLKARKMNLVLEIQIPIDVRRARIVATRIQFPEADDPVLFGDHLTFAIRATLGGQVVAEQTFEKMEIPSFGPRGSILELGNAVIGEFDVHAGELLSVEVLTESGANNQRGFLRFKDALRVDRSNLIGERVPSRRQVWRLWYSVECCGSS